MIFAIVAATIILTGCETQSEASNNSVKYMSNKKSDWNSYNYFNKATIDKHNEVIEVDVEEWIEYPTSDEVLIVDKAGNYYYTQKRDCTLYYIYD